MRRIILAILLTVTSQANAGLIIAVGDSNINNSSNSVFFNNVFGNQNVIGLNSATDPWSLDNWDSVATQTAASYSQSMTLSSSSLIGADWLIASSGSLYSQSTLQLISGFLSAGGNLWVGGEADVFSAFEPANQLLTHLGSSISLDAVSTSQYSSASNTNSDAYTVGTTTFSANYLSTITGGVALYSSNGNVTAAIDRTTFQENATSVPEPSTLAIFALGIMGLASRRFKKQ